MGKKATVELEHGKKEGRKVVGKLKKGNGEKKHRKSRGWARSKEKKERGGKQRKLEEGHGKKEGRKGVGKKAKEGEWRKEGQESIGKKVGRVGMETRREGNEKGRGDGKEGKEKEKGNTEKQEEFGWGGGGMFLREISLNV